MLLFARDRTIVRIILSGTYRYVLSWDESKSNPFLLHDWVPLKKKNHHRATTTVTIVLSEIGSAFIRDKTMRKNNKSMIFDTSLATMKQGKAGPIRDAAQ